MRRLCHALLPISAALASVVLIAPAAAADVTSVTMGGVSLAGKGIVHVEVTATCTVEGDRIHLNAFVEQVTSGGAVYGNGSNPGTCVNGTATGTVQVAADDGRFVRGEAVVYAEACDDQFANCPTTDQETRRLTRSCTPEATPRAPQVLEPSQLSEPLPG